MIDAARYCASDTLRDGRTVEIRALRPEDLSDLIAAVGRASTQSLYRRFFGVKRDFTEKEADFFVNINFVDHVALVALVIEDGRATIVGGGRYVLVQPGKAEVAFAVIDEYQGQGIGGALMRHLTLIARKAALREFVAEVLPQNTSMLKVFAKCGCRMTTRREEGVVHVTLELN